MKFIIEKAAAATILSAVAPAIASRQTIPILGYIRLEAQGDALSVTASDLDVWLTAVASVRGQVSGSACVEGRRLLDIARVLPDGAEIGIDTDSEVRAVIKGGRSRLLIGQLPVADFPAMAASEGDAPDVPAGDLGALLTIGGFCAGDAEGRAYLDGAYFHAASGKLAAVSTNGQRLGVFYSDVPWPETTSFILPSKAIAIAQKMLAGFDGDAEIAFDGKRVRFAVGSTTLVARVIDGEYPDYTRIIPAEQRGQMLADTDLLIGAIERAMIARDEETSRVMLEITADNLVCSAGDPVSGAQGRDEMGIEWTGEPVTLACNGAWLRETLDHVKTEGVVMKVGAKSPIITISETGEAKWLAVVAPQRV